MERAFETNQEILAKGHELAKQVQAKFGADVSDHDSHFHCYNILFPFEVMPESLKEFADGIWYPGYGEGNRHRKHYFSNENVSF